MIACFTLFGPPLPLPNSNPRNFLPFFPTKLPWTSSWPLSKFQGKPLISRCYCDTKNSEEYPMEISACVRGSERNLVVKGRVILSSVPENVILSSADSSCNIEGVFLGAHSPDSSSRHVISLGILRGSRFLACFRFKLWWMTQKMGSRGSEIPCETQFLVVETKPDGEENAETLYSVFLPILEGPFRSSLQGNPNDLLEMCVESGDSDIRSSTFSRAIFVGTAASDPFAAIARAVLTVRSYLGTFRLRTEKRLPAILDLFGWCTWDAFYRAVTQSGVEAGLHSLVAGGAPPKFLIIDDGWQSIVDDGEDSLPRLADIKENAKFQSLESVVSAAKKKYGVKCVYVWHALMGYWGGVLPEAGFDSAIAYPRISPGILENDPLFKTDALTLQGIGLMNPSSARKFYGQLHAYLAAAGVDGVKVDVQSILETLGAGNGGRVDFTRSYHQALDSSIAQNFPDNGCIACMSHHNDALYCERQTAVVRASDDFYPRDPMSHTIHIASVAYNSVFLGEFMVPDWDMFYSLHPAGEFHASARAISGGPVYVSDAPGKHNFELLRKLVLPDGSVLRARLPGRPTADCLFSDPTCDGISLLKIWNMNTFTGVLGVYNCQGAAWSSSEKKKTFHPTNSAALTASIRSNDIHLISEAATEQSWNGDCVIWSHGKGALSLLLKGEALSISLNVLEHEVFTVSPIKVLAPGLLFAPLGLLDMFNGGGAIEGLKYEENVGKVCMEVKGCGRMGAYASAEPKRCLVGAEPANFIYDAYAGLLTLLLEGMPEGDKNVHTVLVEF